MMHDQVTRGGMTRMTAVLYVVIPAHGEVRFAPGGRHLMLEGLTRSIGAGDTIALTFTFARTGDVSARSRVVTYSDLDAALRR
jgi:copper(I)-binding protein